MLEQCDGHQSHLGHLPHHLTHGNYPSPFTATTYPLTNVNAPQPFLLDYTQTLLSLLNVPSTFYAKLMWSPFPHASHGGIFSNWPTKRYDGMIYVLMNNSGQVFLRFGTCFATFIYLVLIL